MTMIDVTPAHIERDRWGRPLIIPPNGGEPIAYTRCTTYVGSIDNLYGLMAWKQRMTALGLAERPDLLLSVSAHRENKRELDKICEKALEHAGGDAAATTGTALHALTELIDRGEPLPAGLSPGVLASLSLYQGATQALKMKQIETFTVLDTLKIGGTPDRVVELDGETYISDLKTGSIDLGILKIAAQLAVYARSSLYDAKSGERTPHGASTNRAIIVHLPATEDPEQARCDLFWVDIESGWEAVRICRDVRGARALKFGQLAKPVVIGEPLARPSLRLETRDEERDADRRAAQTASLCAMIRACTTREQVTELWRASESIWTDGLTQYAKDHLASIGAA